MSLPLNVGRAFYGQRAALREAQERAIAPILAGEDALVIAGTGSGKTEAVVAPVVARHLDHALKASGVSILYLSPTKALANDMVARLEQPMEELRLRVGVRHGDRNDLKRKECPSLLITTPESLDIELVRRNDRLKSVRAVIVDEVHQVAGTQRGRQLSLLIWRLEAWVGRSLQVAGMSATLADPERAWAFLRFGQPCSVIRVDSDRKRSFVLRRETTEHGLVELLSRTSSHGKVLAFAGSRSRTEKLSADMGSRTLFGERIFTHHSSLAQSVREQVERNLREPDATMCLATSTLELGIDVGGIQLVVLIDTPVDWRSFEQRIGRTNRRGEVIEALCVVTPQSALPLFDTAYFLGLIGQVGGSLPRAEAMGEVLGALPQQLASMVRAAGDWLPLGEVTSVLCQVPNVSAEDVQAIVHQLVEEDVLRWHPVASRLGAGERLHQLEEEGSAWGNFPISGTILSLYEDTRRIGEVPASPWNRKLLQAGNTVGFRGRSLRVESVVRGREVRLRQTTAKPTGDLKFGGSSPPRDPRVIHSMPAILADESLNSYMSKGTAEWWTKASSHLSRVLVPGAVSVWRDDLGYGHSTFAGLWINRMIAKALGVEASASEVAVTSLNRLKLENLPAFDDISEMAIGEECPMTSERTVWQMLLPPAAAMREVLSIWRNDPYYRAAWDALRASPLAEVCDDRLAVLAR